MVTTKRGVGENETKQVLKREVMRTQENTMEKGTQYRTLLIQAIHSCATKFADVAERLVYKLRQKDSLAWSFGRMGGEGRGKC